VILDALINLRPRQGKRSMNIQDPVLRKTVEQILRRLFRPEAASTDSKDGEDES